MFHTEGIVADSLVGLVVKASTSKAEDRVFARVESYQ